MRLENLLYTMTMTFSPKKGDGWTEAVMAIFFSITFCMLMAFQKEIPQFFIAIIGIIVGFYFGNQNTKYKKYKKN